jgi:hypothetical protein
MLVGIRFPQEERSIEGYTMLLVVVSSNAKIWTHNLMIAVPSPFIHSCHYSVSCSPDFLLGLPWKNEWMNAPPTCTYSACMAFAITLYWIWISDKPTKQRVCMKLAWQTDPCQSPLLCFQNPNLRTVAMVNQKAQGVLTFSNKIISPPWFRSSAPCTISELGTLCSCISQSLWLSCTILWKINQ